MSEEGDNITVKIYKSKRRDLYNLLDLPNQKFNLEDVVEKETGQILRGYCNCASG